MTCQKGLISDQLQASPRLNAYFFPFQPCALLFPDLMRIRKKVEIVSRQALNEPVPFNLDFRPEFEAAFNLMETSKQCLFITGKAGTGKSTLLQYFRDRTRKKVAVVAPTGAAAINVQGETIHSFFKLPPRPISTAEIRALKNKSLYRALDALVIDEVSMVRADMMDGVDRFMRLNGPRSKEPFGGVQLIVIGDPFQLPPVISTEAEQQYLRANYKTPYFFSARSLREAGLKTVEMEYVYRQKDSVFISLLNAVRNKTANRSDLERLNARCFPDFRPPEDEAHVTLTTTNRRADEINTDRLNALKGRTYRFEGVVSGAFQNQSEHTLPTAASLTLKRGAQVMFVKNDADRRWVNGTMGRIHRIGRDAIDVVIQGDGGGQIVQVEPVRWEMVKYQYDNTTDSIKTDVVGAFTQFPLRLAYAVTIHKSQGKTFDRVIIDLTGGAFACGQVYVALSRCRTFEGLVLATPLRPRDIQVDDAIVQFTRYRHLLETGIDQRAQAQRRNDHAI